MHVVLVREGAAEVAEGKDDTAMDVAEDQPASGGKQKAKGQTPAPRRRPPPASLLV